MNLVIVGSGTLVPHGSRGPAAHWVETETGRVLLDCGPGTERALARFDLDWAALTHVFLTHFHVDHVGGLPGLLFALRHGVAGGREDPLTVIGPPGTLVHFRGLADLYGSWVLEPGYPLGVVELEPGASWEDPSGAFSVTTVETAHSDPSVGFVLDTRDGRLGYTGDTGWTPTLGDAFRGCQILISECSHPEDHGMASHLTPSQLAEICGIARPDLLVPVHAYPSLDPEAIPRLLQDAGYDGWVLPGRDGMSVHLQAGVVGTTETKKP